MDVFIIYMCTSLSLIKVTVLYLEIIAMYIMYKKVNQKQKSMGTDAASEILVFSICSY